MAPQFASCLQKPSRKDEAGNSGISLEDRGEPRLCQNANLQVGAPVMEGRNYRRFQHKIAERSQTHDQDFRARRKIREQLRRITELQCELRPLTSRECRREWGKRGDMWGTSTRVDPAVSFTGVLSRGQTRISSSSCETAIRSSARNCSKGLDATATAVPRAFAGLGAQLSLSADRNPKRQFASPFASSATIRPATA